jgi:haloalkane dehalogenase
VNQATSFNIPSHLYPFERKTVQIQGHTMSYVDEGDPEAHPVVMVHGNPTWSFYYRNLVQTITQKGGRALAMDHIGCGFSDKPNDHKYAYTLNRRVDDLAQWFDHVGLSDQPYSLVVHDWGGMIGLAYALRDPSRLKKVVILNTAAFHIPGDKRLPLTLWLGRNTKIGQFLIQGLNAFSGMATTWACMKPLSQEIKKAYTAPYHSWATRIATHRFVKDIPLSAQDPGYDLISLTQSRLSALEEKPVLIEWGMKDFVFDHTFLSVWKHRLPHAEVHEHTQGGHYILEDEQETILPRIGSFLLNQ